MRDLSQPPSRIPLVDVIDKKITNARSWMTYIYELYRFVKGEQWHELGASGEPALLNSWANVGGANDETAAFRLFGASQLHMKGLIDSGATADGTVIYTLPEAYWPAKTIKIIGYFSGGTENSYQIEIQTDGEVAIYGVSGASPVLSLHTMVDIKNG